MPYIPPQNRPAINERVDALAGKIADSLADNDETAEISVYYRDAFSGIADSIAALEAGESVVQGEAGALAACIVETAAGYGQKGGWTGELNYAVTMLIQAVPFKLYKRGVWAECLRYWLHAQTVGALTRTAYDIHERFGNGWIGNGLAGVFEDIKDELKRRVNTAYEAAQINKSGDCFQMMPFRTRLVPMEKDGVEGYIEILQKQQEPEGPGA
jgi:hypothetical protein